MGRLHLANFMTLACEIKMGRASFFGVMLRKLINYESCVGKNKTVNKYISGIINLHPINKSSISRETSSDFRGLTSVTSSQMSCAFFWV